ncbi:MAG TPA: DUF3488 and transglutaminase-like domain-containing protein, partial [Chthoniobacterales bacterium]|nr:DUF3488 and transglutaminase-like domain-containing protein [Chthoniobacterales bacterium]
WVPVLFVAVLAAKFWMEPRDYRLRSPIWKLLLGAVVLAAVFVTYGSVEGIEPGVSIVVILMSLKILEAHTAREFQVMVNIGFILCLCGFFLSQDFAIALCVLVAFTLLVAALIEFHRGPGADSNWLPLQRAVKLISIAIPLIVLLFLLFPRTSIGFRLRLASSRVGGSGFSGELAPGSVSSLVNSSEVAFRAELPNGQLPRADNLYWRGAVLREGRGFEWRSAAAPAAIPRSSRTLPSAAPVRQVITLEPHNNHWMFALDWPAESPPGSILAAGNYLWSWQTIRSPRKYEVNSFPEIANKQLSARERKILLEVPPNVAPAVGELAQSWTKDGATPARIVGRGLEFFNNNGFRYSLSPGQYAERDLEEFLFNRRVGFCEHYAASFATLMRLAGIPARVVVGYLGGEYNELGRFFLVRQSDAHAWCEVWLPEQGWKRIDPTSVVAPDRVNLGFSGFLERRATTANSADSSGLVRNLTRSHIFHTARLAWQAVNYAWDTRVLSFDEAAQLSLFNSLPSMVENPITFTAGALTAICLLGAMWLLWIRFRDRQERDRIKILHARFCQKLARLGANREPAEGPRDFAMRAARLLPDRAEKIRQISDIYIALRYSALTERGLNDRFAQEVNSF